MIFNQMANGGGGIKIEYFHLDNVLLFGRNTSAYTGSGLHHPACELQTMTTDEVTMVFGMTGQNGVYFGTSPYYFTTVIADEGETFNAMSPTLYVHKESTSAPTIEIGALDDGKTLVLDPNDAWDANGNWTRTMGLVVIADRNKTPMNFAVYSESELAHGCYRLMTPA